MTNKRKALDSAQPSVTQRLRHREGETRRRARIRDEFANLRNALGCIYTDRFTILQTAIALLENLRSRLVVLESMFTKDRLKELYAAAKLPTEYAELDVVASTSITAERSEGSSDSKHKHHGKNDAPLFDTFGVQTESMKHENVCLPNTSMNISSIPSLLSVPAALVSYDGYITGCNAIFAQQYGCMNDAFLSIVLEETREMFISHFQNVATGAMLNACDLVFLRTLDNQRLRCIVLLSSIGRHMNFVSKMPSVLIIIYSVAFLDNWMHVGTVPGQPMSAVPYGAFPAAVFPSAMDQLITHSFNDQDDSKKTQIVPIGYAMVQSPSGFTPQIPVISKQYADYTLQQMQLQHTWSQLMQSQQQPKQVELSFAQSQQHQRSSNEVFAQNQQHSMFGADTHKIPPNFLHPTTSLPQTAAGEVQGFMPNYHTLRHQLASNQLNTSRFAHHDSSI